MGVQIGPGATAHSAEHSIYTLLAYVTADSVCPFVNVHAAVHRNKQWEDWSWWIHSTLLSTAEGHATALGLPAFTRRPFFWTRSFASALVIVTMAPCESSLAPQGHKVESNPQHNTLNQQHWAVSPRCEACPKKACL